jgi:hypothetical protein
MFTADDSGVIPASEVSGVLDSVTSRLLESRSTLASILSGDSSGADADQRLSVVVAELDRAVVDLRSAAQANVVLPVVRARPYTFRRVAGFGRPLVDDDEA